MKRDAWILAQMVERDKKWIEIIEECLTVIEMLLSSPLVDTSKRDEAKTIVERTRLKIRKVISD